MTVEVAFGGRAEGGVRCQERCQVARTPTGTQAGVTGEEVIDETRRFRAVVEAVPASDVEHILV